MIVVTGAAGFIGSCLVNKLNNKGYTDIVLVDDFSNPKKNLNLNNKVFRQKIDREFFLEWLRDHYREVNFVFHLGARTDTTETRKAIFDKLNLNYSKHLWTVCARFELPLVYASSAATYGAGENGYDDDHQQIPMLKPLNLYGESKNNFDLWALQQKEKPYFWAGFKFFNVFGPNEYHKGRMASVVYHAFNKIKDTGKMELFRSHHPDYNDGEQKRDFIYVKDVVNVLFYFLLHKEQPGIYNLGTGMARTFLDLANATFRAMDKEPEIRFIDTPEDIRDKYQYFTEAKMDKLRNVGYTLPFYSLEDAIADYVQDYLLPGTYY
ncbi:MAG: ADP-glyceromanno-heptose 6-epimerase [Bacteroides sp.]|jgi:ADP-L-glycero-D-manno-heptose 6-epimerase|nr:ADP-glyceromanno-heptose 6-epimerase [Bacteroides sp.]